MRQVIQPQHTRVLARRFAPRVHLRARIEQGLVAFQHDATAQGGAGARRRVRRHPERRGAETLDAHQLVLSLRRDPVDRDAARGAAAPLSVAPRGKAEPFYVPLCRHAGASVGPRWFHRGPDVRVGSRGRRRGRPWNVDGDKGDRCGGHGFGP